MNKNLVYLFVAAFSLGSMGYAEQDGGTCIKCEKNREYNRTHPSKYVYYEDYLKDQQESANKDESNNENENDNRQQESEPAKKLEQNIQPQRK